MMWGNWNQMCMHLIKFVQGSSKEDFLTLLWFMALTLTLHRPRHIETSDCAMNPLITLLRRKEISRCSFTSLHLVALPTLSRCPLFYRLC